MLSYNPMAAHRTLPGELEAMGTRRTLTLLTVFGLLSPLAMAAAPVCAPGPHCPMAAAAGGGAPCHGTAIQRDNCCLTDGEALPVEAAPVIAVAVAGSPDAEPAPRLVAGAPSRPQDPLEASPTPRYRLFRALLI